MLVEAVNGPGGGAMPGGFGDMQEEMGGGVEEENANVVNVNFVPAPLPEAVGPPPAEVGRAVRDVVEDERDRDTDEEEEDEDEEEEYISVRVSLSYFGHNPDC